SLLHKAEQGVGAGNGAVAIGPELYPSSTPDGDLPLAFRQAKRYFSALTALSWHRTRVGHDLSQPPLPPPEKP
ncbi:MAG: hypothetical protein HQL48_06140, partial [Gammaproteobacteria bacterium]|nr:hypothetical protein [Gammaproteobacteria bacterium]